MMDKEELETLRNEYTAWMLSVGHTMEHLQNDPYYRIMTTIRDGREI